MKSPAVEGDASRRRVKIAYFVHDLGDAAVARRTTMFLLGGASVSLIGFSRDARSAAKLDGVERLDIGRTQNGKLGLRALSVLKNVVLRRKFRDLVRDADVVVARNLEMLSIASSARSKYAPASSLVYECLDIHRVMLGRGGVHLALRALERRLIGLARKIIVSSPAFDRVYFRGIQHVSTPVLLVENKVLAIGSQRPRFDKPIVGPWRIGWFGVLRCRKSLYALSEAVSRSAGKIEVHIRGKVAEDVIPEFLEIVDQTPGMYFHGSYTQDSLPEIYGDVHFSWAVDYFEEGGNSDWLLPNRLYEGTYYGAVPIAQRGGETSSWLEAAGLGLLLENPLGEVGEALERVEIERFREMKGAVQAFDVKRLAFDRRDIEDLIDSLVE